MGDTGYIYIQEGRGVRGRGKRGGKGRRQERGEEGAGVVPIATQLH